MQLRRLVAGAALLWLGAAAGQEFVQADGLAVGRELRLARQWLDLPTAPLSAWKVNNYEQQLTIGEAAQPGLDGAPCWQIRRDGPPTDTAWELTSPPLAVVAGSARAFRTHRAGCLRVRRSSLPPAGSCRCRSPDHIRSAIAHADARTGW